MKNTTKGAFILTAAFAVAGCVSTQLNPTAKIMEADEYRNRVDSIEPGDSRHDMLEKLELTELTFDELTASWDPRDAYNYVYGDTNAAARPRLEEYQRLEVFSFPYYGKRDEERFGLLHTKTNTTGDNLNTVIALRDGKVINDPRVAELSVVDGTSRDSNIDAINPINMVPGL